MAPAGTSAASSQGKGQRTETLSRVGGPIRDARKDLGGKEWQSASSARRMGNPLIARKRDHYAQPQRGAVQLPFK
ncbi:hypothetical protein ROR02_11680 [Pararhodospirillum oryzae]|uniref:Uncharacterized protein n=1 Tax=Pararhodospirillum oryzae TaxID=478448 RepID=A0A512H6G8_9PROT|nr:hypothetical protein ROR02_11680 [Pararhodospirillum oryzae]